MVDIINLEFLNGNNFSIPRSEVTAISADTVGFADFRLVTLGGLYDLKYGGSNPNSWSDAKNSLFENIPILNLESAPWKDLVIRKDAVKVIQEISNTEFYIRAYLGFQCKYGGDNPSSWSELKTLVFGP